MSADLPSPLFIASPDLWLAVPHDRQHPPIAVASSECIDLHRLLLDAGIDPDACDIGRARLSNLDIAVDWDRVIHQSFD